MPIASLGLGGGMIVSGLLNALVSSVNSRKGISANADQLQKNQEFQEALQKKQWQHAEQLQKDMRDMTRRNFLEQLEYQKQSADLQSLEQRWPLPSSSPRLLINEFNEFLKAGEPIPLQLIIVENGDLGKTTLSIKSQVHNAINELNKFMSLHYNRNSHNSVKIYDSGKSGASFGSSEVDTIFQVFKVAPTMILSVRVHGSEYVLECWHWGSGAVELPSMVELFRCNVEELQFSILKDIAEEWKSIKVKLSVEDSDKDKLVGLLETIDNEENRLRQLGATNEQIREYALKPYREEILSFVSLKPTIKSSVSNPSYFVGKINTGIERCILSSFRMCASLLSDAHFLLEYKVAPKFLQICASDFDSEPSLMEYADNFFNSLLNKVPDSQKSDKALMFAQMATAYQSASCTDKAMMCSINSANVLKEMVEPDNFVYEASEDMKKCVKTLKLIPEVEKCVPWIKGQNFESISADELNHHAAALYKSGKVYEAIHVWKKGVHLGHVKSVHNLALVLDSLGRKEEAYEYYALAIQKGDESLYDKGHDLALWYCCKGKWRNAFRMWTCYLHSSDRTNRNCAAAYSSALLFTSVYGEIDSNDCECWISAMGGELDGQIIQQIAENFLVEHAASGDQACINVLSWWYKLSKGASIPFIHGVNLSLRLIYELPMKLSAKQERFFANCLSKTTRPDLK